MKRHIRLALRYIFKGKIKHISFISIVSVLGIAVGVSALIVVISVMNGFDKDLMERLLRFNYHILIEVQENKDLPDLKELKSIDGVSYATVFLQSQVLADLDNYIVPLLLRGIDFSNKNEYENFNRYIISKKNINGFFIGDGLTKRFFLKDDLKFYSLDEIGFLKTEKISGVFKIGLYDVDNNYIITDIENFKKIIKDYNKFIGIRLNNPFSADIVKKKILDKFNNLFVITWIESNKILFSALKLEKIVMFIILSLIILVASFNIFATLTVKTVEKIKDIGILKSIGYTNRDILFIFTLEGIILGIIGVILGVFFGLFLCFILKKYPFIKLPEEIYYIEYLPVAVNYRDIFLISIVGILLSFISSIFPAIRASRLSPTEAIRYE